MCTPDTLEEQIPEISRGAALAHGCCGGFARTLTTATIIAIRPANEDQAGKGSCAGDSVPASHTSTEE